MTKEDVGEPPAEVPKKRRALELAPDLWIAKWLAREDLTPSERRRLAEVRQSRRDAVPDRVAGIVVGREGVTPAQLAAVGERLAGVAPTAICYAANVSTRLRRVFPDVPIIGAPDHLAVVRNSDVVVAAPKEPDVPTRKTGVWEAVKLAKHRSLPVYVVMPNGGSAET